MNNFEDYVLTIQTTPDNTLTDNFIFLEENKIVDEDTYVNGDFYSVYNNKIVNLGFNYEINGKTYNRALVSLYGYIILIGDNQTSVLDIIDDVFFNDSTHSIRLSPTRPHDHILICPWYTDDIIPSYKNIDESHDPSNFHNGKKSGVFYKNINNSINGDKFVVNWSIISGKNIIGLALFPGIKTNFQCEIHKNGKIIFNYKILEDSISRLNKNNTKAVCGVFIEGNSQLYRDFSSILDPTFSSNVYKYGGFVTGSITENSKPYRNLLNFEKNWPGKLTLNSRIVFQPNNREFKKIAPRKINNKNKLINSKKYYDDRITKINTISTNVFPYTEKRFQLNGSFLSDNIQDVFSVDTIDIPNTKINTSQNNFFINDIELKENSKPFIEEFFFDSNQSSEISIKNITLDNLYDIPMLSKTSSMYYFNFDQKAFMIYDQNFLQDPLVISSSFSSYTYRSFDHFYSPTGFHCVLTGSSFVALDPPYLPVEKKELNRLLIFDQKQYDFINYKNFERSSNFYKNDNSLFKLDLDSNDFILEEIKIQFGFKAGQSWFDDITNYQHHSVGKIDPPILQNHDCGGPGITVSLINSRNNNIDYITTGFITHENDYDYNANTTIEEIFEDSPIEPEYPKNYFKRIRIKAYKEPDFVISNGEFTGSINLNLKSKVYNGIKMVVVYQPTNHLEFLKSEYLDLDMSGGDSQFIDAIFTNELAPLSRKMTGEDFSERSYKIDISNLDKTKFIENKKVKIKNSFFSGSMSETDYSYLIVNGGDDKKYIMVSEIYSEDENPYRLKNGDKLTLLVSKCRPSIVFDGTSYFVSGTHDFKISNDDIKLKLIGRYTKRDDEVNEGDFNNKITIDSKNINYNMPHIFDVTDKRYIQITTSSLSGSTLQSNFNPSYSPTGFSGFRTETTREDLDYLAKIRILRLT